MSTARRAYAVTFTAEALMMGLGLVVVRIAAHLWGPLLFGEYVLARRNLSLIYLLPLLGLSISIPRHVAVARASPQGMNTSGLYLATGLLLVAPSLALLGVILAAAPDAISGAMFGSARYSHLLLPLFWCVTGLVLHGLVYGYLRGHLYMGWANTLYVLNQGVIPLLAFALPHPDVARVFLFTGKTWVFLSGLAIVFILARDTRKARVVRRGDLGSKARELLRYGIPRIPGDFALIAFFAAPAMLTAHRASIEQAGFVAFATSVLSSIGQIFGPISTVQLPAVTRMVTRGEGKPLRRDLFWLVTGGLAVTAVGIAVLEIIAGWLVRWYLGPAFQESAALLRIIAPAALPYVLYILLRSPIDALAVRAHNTRNLMAGLLVFLAIASFASSAREIVAGLTVGFAVTAVLTIRDARTLLRAAAAPLVATPPAV